MIPRDAIAKHLIDGAGVDPIAARNLATTAGHAYRYTNRTPVTPALSEHHQHHDLAGQIAAVLRGTDRRVDVDGRADRWAAHLIHQAARHPQPQHH